MPVDYSSPVIDVTLADSGGRSVDLRSWFRRYAPGEGTAPFTTDVEITLNRNGGAQLSVSLQPPYRSWKRFVDEYLGLLLPQSVLSVSLGFHRRKTRVYRGLLQDLPDVSYSDDFVDVDLNAAASTWYAARTDTELYESVKSLQSVGGAFGLEVDIFDVLREIARSNGIELYYLTREGKESPIGRTIPDSLSSLDQTIEAIPHGSDFQRISRIITDLARLQFYAHGDRIVIYNPGDMMKRSETPVFEWKGRVGIGEGFYPITDFSSDDVSTSLMRGAQKIVSKDIDGSDREVKETVSGEGDQGTNATAGREKSTPDEPPATKITDDNKPSPSSARRRGRPMHQTAEDPTGRQKMQAAKRRGEEGSGVSAEIETLGHPFLVPGLAVRLRNLTGLYNGKYQIMQAVHSSGGSGYTTSLSLLAIGIANEGSHYLSDYEGETSVDEGERNRPPQGDRKMKRKEEA